MHKLSIGILLVLVLAQSLCVSSSNLDMFSSDDNDQRELKEEFLQRREASKFFKRLLHPFSTKCEEQKREVRERFEEKCESVVPFQR